MRACTRMEEKASRPTLSHGRLASNFLQYKYSPRTLLAPSRPLQSFLRVSGAMLLAAVSILCLVNVLVSPVLPTDAPQSVVMSGAASEASVEGTTVATNEGLETVTATPGTAVKPEVSEALFTQKDVEATSTMAADHLVQDDGPLVTEAPVEEVPLDHFFSEAPISKDGEVDTAVDGIPLDDVDLSVDATADIDTASFDDQVAGFTFGPPLESQEVDV
ncbi:hypothetical protein SprV_0200876000 [Sparganum proliferum]